MISVPHVRAKLALLLVAATGALGLLYWWYTLAGGKPVAQERFEFTAVVPDGQQLVPNSDVAVAGVRVGQVTDITNRGGRGVIRISLFDKQALPIYRDATLEVRAKTVVGESYVDLRRGTPAGGRMPADAELPLDQAKSTILIDQVLESLDPATRKAVSLNLRALGRGLEGRSRDVSSLLGSLQPALDDTGEVARTLRQQRTEVAALVSQAGQLMRAVGDRTGDLRRLVTAAKTTAEAVARRDRALGEGIEELPATLQQARGSVSKLGGFSGRATPVVENLRAALSDLHPVLRDLRPSAVGARRLVREIPPLLERADPLLASLRRFAAVAPPAVDGLDSLLCEANPMLSYLTPYRRDLAAFTGNFGRFHVRDRWGNVGQVHPLLNDRSYTGWSPELRKLAAPLLDDGVVGKVLKTGQNAYPEPGTSGRPQPFSGRYPRVEAEKRCRP